MCVLCFSDSTGNVIDLVKDPLPDMQLSEEDRKKNLELLEQAKKASDRFLTRRGRRSTSSLTDSPTGELTSFIHMALQQDWLNNTLLFTRCSFKCHQFISRIGDLKLNPHELCILDKRKSI